MNRNQQKSRFLPVTHLLAILFSFSPMALSADELPKPQGKVLLTIKGNITHTNTEGAAEFDLAMLENFKPQSFTTRSPWTEGPTEFEGVLMTELLKYVGAGSTDVHAVALDDYWFDFDTRNFESVPVIVAYKKAGKYMRIRDQGPLWIMFPFDDYPETNNTISKNTCIWHLTDMEVK